MEQSRTAWATNILALYHEISTTNVLVHKNKCAVLKFLVDCTAQYVQLWWIGRFGEEINTKSAEAVGKELLGVLKKGLRLLQHCGERDCAKSNFIIFYGGGEFCEVVGDVERYCRMMNRLIARILECDPVGNPAKKKLIKQLQDKVELDCCMLQDALTSAHAQDRNALIKNIKSSEKDTHSGSGWVWGSNKKDLSRRYIGSAATLVVDPFASNIGHHGSIAINDIIKTEICLGRGSFGVISKGFWCEIIPVAIKEFFYHGAFDYEYKIFMKLLATNCSHIVQVLGHSQLRIDGNTNRKILVMELMDMDLKKLIENKKETNPTAASPFSVYESTDLLLQIAKGMRDLHRVHMIHRDIKTSNILVKKNTADGSLTVKLADFGETKAYFQTKDNVHSKRGTTLYMAPEMASDEGNYSKKVDVYSFGIVCMEILTGKPPNLAMQEDLKKGQMPPYLKSISIPLYRIISSCVELDKDKRPSFEEICDHLWAFKESILIIQDEVPSYIDERVLSNFRMYTKTLGEEGISVVPRISTPTGRRAIYSFWEEFFRKGVRHLPIDSLVDIELHGLSIESSGEIKLLQPWDSVRNPFIGTGVEPQNHLSGNPQQDLGIFGQFKKLVVDQGKKLNVSFSIGGWDNSKNFSDAFSTDENRTRFINSILELCRAYPIFNGLLIDWMFLSDDGVNYGKASNIVRREDGENFILVLEGLRSTLPPGFVIGMFASRIPKKTKWPIERISRLIDQIQLDADLIPGEETAYHRSNLYSSSHQNWSYNEAIKYYLSRGVDSSKLFISAIDLVRGFSNADEIGKPAKLGLPNAVYGLCPSELVGHGFVERWDDEAKAPYAYHPQRRLICVYDNARSIKEKAEYIKANNLGGIWMNHCRAAKACSLFKAVHDHLTHGTLSNTNNQA